MLNKTQQNYHAKLPNVNVKNKPKQMLKILVRLLEKVSTVQNTPLAAQHLPITYKEYKHKPTIKTKQGTKQTIKNSYTI